MESSENNTAVFQPFHKPWKSIEPIPRFPQPPTIANLTEIQNRKEPSPARLTFAPFRLILRLEKTGGPEPTSGRLSECYSSMAQPVGYLTLRSSITVLPLCAVGN